MLVMPCLDVLDDETKGCNVVISLLCKKGGKIENKLSLFEEWKS